MTVTPTEPVEFKAATWNVYAGTSTEELEPILKRMVRDGVSLFYLQEADDDHNYDITRMLVRNGLQTYHYLQWRLAWVPEVWRADKVYPKRLSDTVYWSKRGKPDELGWSAVGRFTHLDSGERLKALSYHTPSGVQVPEWNQSASARWQSLNEQMAEMVKIARGSRIPHLLFAGDDNVDERGQTENRWKFMTDTDPLIQLQAPEATHGKRRKIDDFRYAGLEPVGKGSVRKGGGDHKVFLQTFRFVPREVRSTI